MWDGLMRMGLILTVFWTLYGIGLAFIYWG